MFHHSSFYILLLSVIANHKKDMNDLSIQKPQEYSLVILVIKRMIVINEALSRN